MVRVALESERRARRHSISRQRHWPRDWKVDFSRLPRPQDSGDDGTRDECKQCGMMSTIVFVVGVRRLADTQEHVLHTKVHTCVLLRKELSEASSIEL